MPDAACPLQDDGKPHLFDHAYRTNGICDCGAVQGRSTPSGTARRVRWLPRRCAHCRRWLPKHRVRLGLTYCSGPCYAALYQGGTR